MSSERQIEFTKENIDTYLKELAKAYRKQIGKNMPAEMILIGGASVLVNYGFRDMTTDIDAVIQAASAMKDVINRVGDRFDLPNGWLNEDFRKTASYSPADCQASATLFPQKTSAGVFQPRHFLGREFMRSTT